MKIRLRNTHGIKWLYDGSNTIDEMLERLSAEIAELEDMQELGVKLEAKSEDDHTRFVATIESGSEEYNQLIDLGFEIEDQE